MTNQRNWKELGQLDTCFWSQVYEINYTRIQKQKKIKSPSTELWKTF